MAELPTVLSVHAVDTRGEEGVLADGVVLRDLRCAPVMVASAILASSGNRLDTLEALPRHLLDQQFQSILSTCRPAAARTGILRGAEQIRRVGEVLGEYGIPNVVVAPVLKVAGTEILDRASRDATRDALYPLARLVVIRAGDLQTMAGVAPGGIEDMKEAARRLREEGAGAVLVAGVFSGRRVLDLLDDGGATAVFDAPRLSAPRVGGLTGAHVSVLAAELARGARVDQAVAAAQRYVVARLQGGR